MEEKVLSGHKLSDGKYIPTNKNPIIYFKSKDNKVFAIDEPSLYKNILLVGGAGTGKTKVMNQIIKQVREYDFPSSGFHIIFDTKADYINHRGFYKSGDYIIGNSISFRNRSAAWNIFDEVLIDDGGIVPNHDQPFTNYEANAKEIASVIFRDRGSKTQPFFANAARDIFANTIIYFIRRYRDNYAKWKDKLNNYELKNFLLKWGPKDFSEFFSIYPDMCGLITYFGDGKSNQAMGVFSELRSMVYDCFNGAFATKPTNYNSFSVRKAVREKKNRALFIEYDLSAGESLTPMYRLIIDLALKEALGENDNGRVHLFLDELKLLPKVTHLQDALNFGRSKKVSIVAGIQNINQIYSTYGEFTAKEILEGFASLFAFKASDFTSREYISQRFGPNITSYRHYNHGNQPVDNLREGFVVEHWDQRELQVGEAVIGLASQVEPFKFAFIEDPFAND